MPARGLLPVILSILCVWAGGAWAQQSTPPLAMPVAATFSAMPDHVRFPAQEPLLPNGQTVSQPLQPVIEPSQRDGTNPGGSAVPEIVEDAALTPLGRSWYRYEYLLWWSKAQPLPPLVTASPPMLTPQLNGEHTTVLIGNDSLANPDTSGGRFTYGFSWNAEETAGLEVTYFFLGSQTSTALVTNTGPGPRRQIGRPLVDPAVDTDYVAPVAIPGQLTGGVTVATTSRVTGWEVNGVMNLVHIPGVTLNALAGYRYFLLNEGLRIEQRTWSPATGGAWPSVLLAADQFDAHNRFHGGQFGLNADLGEGPVFLELTGKIALGRTVQVVRSSGQSVMVTPGFPLPVAVSTPNGILGQPSNSGRFTNSAFAVLPEAGFKFGYRLGQKSRCYFGYNFIYLSDVVRAGDQVDRQVDPAWIPGMMVGHPVPELASNPHPTPRLERTDFWVQGLIFGLEYRY
ncbi:MAG: BBP7 family outer membrane beta-barrel protein [Bacteroidales bacterium]|nr:BBP7 family outer membrane beta-barrel protein [Bacteroidales bacterium]